MYLASKDLSCEVSLLFFSAFFTVSFNPVRFINTYTTSLGGYGFFLLSAIPPFFFESSSSNSLDVLGALTALKYIKKYRARV